MMEILFHWDKFVPIFLVAIYCPIGWIYGIEIRNGCSVELCGWAQTDPSLLVTCLHGMGETRCDTAGPGVATGPMVDT